jgi:phosphatidate cytidylyltransferase
MSNFWARTITGLSMVFILLAGLYFNEWIFASMFFVITILGILEFYQIVTSDNCQPQKVFGVVSGALIYLTITIVHYFRFNVGKSEILLMCLIPLFSLPFVIEIYRKKTQPLTNIALTILPIIYIAIPLALLNVMNEAASIHFLGFPVFLTGYFVLTWSYDTGAYLYGRQFGKHKLFERISPKKTWEGTLGGSGIALFVAAVLFFLVKEIRLADWLALTFLILFFGTFGDLVESLIKRNLNIKDSGSILPGHGGILDRFDTIFISAPFVFLYFIIRLTYL